MAAPRVPSISSEVSAAIQRALRPGASPFARLGLPDALCETSVLRRAYRTAALLIHPDKCAHPEAKMAFQKLSEAFDVLSGPEGQQQQLDGPKGGYPGRPYERGGRYDRPAPPGCWGECEEDVDGQGQRGGKSWWDAGFSDFEKRLRAREADQLRKEAMESALQRGEDSLDAFMSVLEAELDPKAEERNEGRDRRDEARASRGTKRPSAASGIPKPGTRQNVPSFSMGRKPFRGPAMPASVSSSCSSASTSMADVLLSHLDSDGSELSD
ncbi:unnamed protein product [Durusdinium trenchii]|uniref:DnaJ homolog subfamily C member 14 n=2 Tax=Durusdinium trenchii TaxID=1381693 RepID=A0ABP0JXW3_9DINO